MKLEIDVTGYSVGVNPESVRESYRATYLEFLKGGYDEVGDNFVKVQDDNGSESLGNLMYGRTKDGTKVWVVFVWGDDSKGEDFSANMEFLVNTVQNYDELLGCVAVEAPMVRE